IFFYAPRSLAPVPVFASPTGLRRLGVGNIGVLFGVAFMSHRIGSFLGAWLGGPPFDATGSRDAVRLPPAAARPFAALPHLPIRDRLRLAPFPSWPRTWPRRPSPIARVPRRNGEGVGPGKMGFRPHRGPPCPFPAASRPASRPAPLPDWRGPCGS